MRFVQHSVVAWWFAINPDGYSICPTVSTEIAAPLESDVNSSSGGGVGGINGTTAATAHSNDITTAHQESCLWPNALQVSPFFVVALWLSLYILALVVSSIKFAK